MRFFALISLVLTLMVGCKTTPDPGDLVENMVVQTLEDKNTDFSFYNSFTLSLDTIVFYSNLGDPDDTLWIDHDLNSLPAKITRHIQDEMIAAGYSYSLKDEDPDLGVAVTVYENYNVYQQLTYPTYYSSYYGYGGYYGPIVSTYSTSSSTLVIYLVDLKTPHPEGRKVIWKVFIGDLFQSVDTQQKAIEAITRAFNQSPYIGK